MTTREMDTHLQRDCQKHLDLMDTAAQKMKEKNEELSDALLRANHRIESLEGENKKLKRRVKKLEESNNSGKEPLIITRTKKTKREKGRKNSSISSESKDDSSKGGEGSSPIEACVQSNAIYC